MFARQTRKGKLNTDSLTMPLRKTISLLFSFYKNFLLAGVLVTTACLLLFWQYGMNVFVAVFWLKIATLGIIYWFINSYKNNEYYYYQNLGISKTLLWCTTLSFDFILFILLIIQVYKLT